MGMITEFKAFAMKGNLVDMAVGFVMGSAFGTVVKAFIDGVFMPAISPVLGGIDLAKLKYTVSEAVMDGDTVVTPAAIIDFGNFLTALISFIIVAFVMFMIIKGMNKAQAKEEETPAAPPANEVLLAEIRDLMAKQAAN